MLYKSGGLRKTSVASLAALVAFGVAAPAISANAAPVPQVVASAVAETDTVTLVRADWFVFEGRIFVSIEAKTDAADGNATLTASWDSGPGTPAGSGGSTTLSRYVDAGTYLYHRTNNPLPADVAPGQITITSSLGGSVTGSFKEWLGKATPRPTGYKTGFIDEVPDPTQVNQRFEALAAEFPGLAEIVTMPELTHGYLRVAQAQFGPGGTGANAQRTFYVTSNGYGSDGGNDMSMELKDPGVPSSPLSVSVSGKDITVTLATDATGAITTTAAEAVAAINANAGAAALLRADLYRGNAGTGVVAAATRAQLSDGLKAPASIARAPFQMKVLRVGKVRDGSKTGVFIYSGEHPNEVIPVMATIETAERLLRNYATDAHTREMVDNLDIFLLPWANPDGGHYTVYDTPVRKNMTNTCGPEKSDPGYRNSWGTNVNRNFATATVFDGWSGASTDCINGNYAGPKAESEPEVRNQVWLANNYKNIKFAMNTHCCGGYFMWTPGAYKVPGRVPVERPDLATEAFFYEASEHILSAVQSERGTAVWPGRTGPIIDVLYSAAGNSADYFWMEHGVYAWAFEVHGPRWNPDTKSWYTPSQTGDERTRSAMEYASGDIGIIEVALAYELDKNAPRSSVVVKSRTENTTTFTFTSNKPANIYYTLDGSRPDLTSPKLVQAGVREGGASLTVDSATELKWFAVDVAGNVENGYNPDPASGDTRYRHQFLSAGAGADGEQVIVAEVNAGALTLESAASTVTMPSTTLTGADQVVEGALNAVSVRDARGTSAGWSLTGQVSDFVSASGIIVADNLGWLPSASAASSSLPTLPGNDAAVSAGPQATPGTGTGLGDARMLCGSPAGHSAGAFTCNAGLSLGVPGSARSGVYTGVLTLTLV